MQSNKKQNTMSVQCKMYIFNLGYSKEPSQCDNCFEHQNTSLNSSRGMSAAKCHIVGNHMSRLNYIS